MLSPTQPRIGRPLFWLSIAAAAVLALKLPTAWIAYSDRQTHSPSFLNFHPLLAVLYVPLAFGLIWPILIRIAAWVKQRPSQSLVWPARPALILFTLSASISIPFMILEYRSLMHGLQRVQAERMRLEQIQAVEETEKAKALAELRSNGIASLSEPLTGPQTAAVNSYLDNVSQNTLELENASRHYRTSVHVMKHLSEMRECPSQALEIVYDNVVELQKDPQIPDAGNLSEVLYNVAWHPNVPVSVLVRMLDNPDWRAQRAAAANPRVPKEATTAYLEKATASRSFSEREHAAGSADATAEELGQMLGDENFRVREAAAANPNTPKLPKIANLRKAAVSDRLWDRIQAARSADCPPEELKKLSLDPATAKYVASNPATPTELLQTLADSDDPETCRRAVANLTKRQQTKQ